MSATIQQLPAEGEDPVQEEYLLRPVAPMQPVESVSTPRRLPRGLEGCPLARTVLPEYPLVATNMLLSLRWYGTYRRRHGSSFTDSSQG